MNKPRGRPKIVRIFQGANPRRFHSAIKARIRNPYLRQAVLISQTMDGNFRVHWFNQSTLGHDLALLELAKAQTLSELLEAWKAE